MAPKPLDPDLVDALAAASSHGHYYPPVELVDAVLGATEGLGPAEVISQFELKDAGFPARWMEFQQWAYLKAAGDVLLVVPPPDLIVQNLFEQMKKAVEDGARVCCMILPLDEVLSELGALAHDGATIGISYEKCRWRLLRGGTRRKDYAVLVAMTDGRHDDTYLRGGLDRAFWFAEHRSTVEHR